MRKKAKKSASGKPLPLWMKLGGAGVALLLLTVLVFLALLFSPWREIGPLAPGMRDFSLQFKLLSRVSKELGQNPVPVESRLRLAPEEIDSLLRLADGSFTLFGGSAKQLPPRYYQIKSHDRAIEFVFPLNTGMRWLFGGVIYIRGAVEPEKDGEELHLHFRRLKAGAWPIPVCLADAVAKRQLKKLRGNKDFQRVDRIVKALYFERGGDRLTIVYRPATLVGILF